MDIIPKLHETILFYHKFMLFLSKVNQFELNYLTTLPLPVNLISTNLYV